MPSAGCATLDNFHFVSVEQGLHATAFITSGLDPRCGLLPRPGAACTSPTPCPSYAINDVPIGIALLVPALGHVPLPPGARRKALQLPPIEEHVYGATSSLVRGLNHVRFASAFNLSGELRISGGAPILNVSLANIQLGLLDVGLIIDP